MLLQILSARSFLNLGSARSMRKERPATLGLDGKKVFCPVDRLSAEKTSYFAFEKRYFTKTMKLNLTETELIGSTLMLVEVVICRDRARATVTSTVEMASDPIDIGGFGDWINSPGEQ